MRVLTSVDSFDLMSISGKNWLTNFALDAGIALQLSRLPVVDLSSASGRKPVTVMSAQYYTAMANPLSRSTKTKDKFIPGRCHPNTVYKQYDGTMLPCDTTDVVFPVWRPGHFILVIVSPTASTIFILDSFRTKHKMIEQVMVAW